MVSREDGKPITIGEGTKIGDVPYFVDGAILKVNSKNPKKQVVHSGIKASDIQNTGIASKCNHPPGGKCLNCMGVTDKKPPLPKKEGEKMEE